jgi:hypothetical protein
LATPIFYTAAAILIADDLPRGAWRAWRICGFTG